MNFVFQCKSTKNILSFLLQMEPSKSNGPHSFSSELQYLGPDDLKTHADVKIRLFPQDSTKSETILQVNRLFLASISPTLRSVMRHMNMDEDVVIMSDSPIEEVSTIISLCTTGKVTQLPNLATFTAFGIPLSSFKFVNDDDEGWSDNENGFDGDSYPLPSTLSSSWREEKSATKEENMEVDLDEEDMDPLEFCKRDIKVESVDDLLSEPKMEPGTPKTPLRYRCDQCGFATRNNHTYKVHVWRHTKPEDETHYCIHCEIGFKSRVQLSQHNSMHHIRTKVDCSQCDKTFKSTTLLVKHEIKMHGEDSLERQYCICEVCGIKLLKRRKREHYLQKHMESQNLPCEHCPKVFRNDRLLKDHYRICHSNVPCDTCGKVFPSARNLSLHKLSHLPESELPFRCNVCGKGITTNDKLKKHMEIHLDERRHKCRYCPSAFNSSSTRNGHEQQVHLGNKRVHKPKTQ